MIKSKDILCNIRTEVYIYFVDITSEVFNRFTSSNCIVFHETNSDYYLLKDIKQIILN